MTKRLRSPNYPAISLPEALELLGRLWDGIQSNAAPRDLVAKGMGYTGLHGKSASALSALVKYGLLEREGEDLKISERGMMYLHPESPEERTKAILDAAAAPELFAELKERFSGGSINEELLRNYLVRKGFVSSALSGVLLAFRETMSLVERESERHELDSKAFAQGTEPTNQQTKTAPQNLEQRGRTDPPTPVPDAGKFRVSMTDEFLVDVSASQLDREGVRRLVEWLNANKELVPEAQTRDRAPNVMAEQEPITSPAIGDDENQDEELW
jgi:hypothetical protein